MMGKFHVSLNSIKALMIIKFLIFNAKHRRWYVRAKVHFALIGRTVKSNIHTPVSCDQVTGFNSNSHHHTYDRKL
jgi:hypothetical protein